jgi:DNA-binding CsgD family transcriptional regulator
LSGDDVRALCALLDHSPMPQGHEGDPGWPKHFRGALAELDGDFAGAALEYRASIDTGGWKRSLPAEADAYSSLARCELHLGDLESAKKNARTALGLLERWPSWRRDEAQALVRRLENSAGSSTEGVLTARELEVAALVAEGLSNGEIGRRLFISTKTASVHVSSILRKLAMSNRSEIAVWAVGQGLRPVT